MSCVCVYVISRKRRKVSQFGWREWECVCDEDRYYVSGAPTIFWGPPHMANAQETHDGKFRHSDNVVIQTILSVI